ncbi:MAG: DEAD/DEAH box helicase [Treponemataceae bacterium]
MKFTEFNFHSDLLQGIENAGYVDCTPVQEQVLKGALDGTDLYVQSQTGTGKTAAFLIAIIQQILSREEVKDKKALIMVPTRELAVQVEEEAKKLACRSKIKSACFYGGVGYGRQTESLKKNIDIIVGTPGRIIDLQEQKILDLSNIAFLVLDEADRMFDMGFYPDLRKLLKFLPKSEKRQTMLFSATLNTYVKNLAWEYTVEAKEIEIKSENITVDEISQQLFHVASGEKMNLLLGIIKNENPESLIIFCNTKKSCELVSKRLKLNGIESEFIIGDLPQSKRLQVLNSFKSGSLKCLVATDVAARGIDVDNLAMVVNFDLPNEAENYVHRIGRTARAGKTGTAYTFCSEQDVYNLPSIERYIDTQIPATVAYEEQMVKDKSEGIYIKLNTYREDEEESRKKSRYNKIEKNSKRTSKTDYKKSYTRDYKKGSGKNFKQKYEKKEQENLENLSFEQRMEFYKKKYNNSAYKDDNTKQNGYKNKNGRKNNKQNMFKNKKNELNNKNTTNGKNKNEFRSKDSQIKKEYKAKKLGFLERITKTLKAAFGKNRRSK